MKRIILIMTGITTLCVGRANAKLGSYYNTDDLLPVATFGARAGIQMQYISGKTPWNRNYDEGPVAGLFLSVHQNMIGGRVEASLRQLEYRHNQTGARISMICFDVPLLFEFRPIPWIKVNLGPQATAFTYAHDRRKNDVRNLFKPYDFSIVFGAEGELPFNLVVGARAVKGIININDSGVPGSWTTTSAQFYVGYHLPN